MADKKLTPKQKVFIDEYLIDLNATQAAMRAGYSKKTAPSMGNENLKKPQIQAEIQRRMDKRSKEVGLTADQIVSQLSKIAMYDVTKGMSFDEETGRMWLSELEELDGKLIDGLTQTLTEYMVDGKKVEKVVTTIKGSDRLKAFELLMKHNNMFSRDRQADALTAVQVKKIEAETRMIEARAKLLSGGGDGQTTELMEALNLVLGVPSKD